MPANTSKDMCLALCSAQRGLLKYNFSEIQSLKPVNGNLRETGDQLFRFLHLHSLTGIIKEVKTLFPDLQSANTSNECLLEMVHRTKKTNCFCH
jgi:hypothetical protein